MILERLPYDKVFTLDGPIFQETLVAKVNDGYPLEDTHLQSLSQHSEVLSRLSRMSVHHSHGSELNLLGEIVEQCPNFKFLALDFAYCDGPTSLEKNRRLLERITKLCLNCMEHRKARDLFKSICKKCPNLEHLALGLSADSLRALLGEICGKCAKNMEYGIRTRDCQNKHKDDHQILRRLRKLRISYSEVKDFPLLNRVCERYPITLNLNIVDGLQKLTEYPAIPKRLTELSLRFMKKEDTAWLDSRETLPRLRSLEIKNLIGLQTLSNCSHVYDILSSLNASLRNMDDVLVFKKICKLCHQLQDYEITMSLRLLNTCLGDFPMGKFIVLSDEAKVIGESSRKNLELRCEFRHINGLLEQAESLRSLAAIHLTFTTDMDEVSALALLRKVCENAPILSSLEIRWLLLTEPSAEFLGLLREIKEKWEIPSIICRRHCGNVGRYIECEDYFCLTV